MSWPQCPGRPSASVIIYLKLHKVPRPRVSLRSCFMASFTGPPLDGGIALPCSAKSKTLVRRLQRKHSEQSYRHMKEKLLSMLKPMPIAAYSANLEEFRQTLYANSDDAKSLRGESTVAGLASFSPTMHLVPTQATGFNRCSWCGI